MAGWTLHTHLAIFSRDERGIRGVGWCPDPDTPAQEMPVGTVQAQPELRPGFRLLLRGRKRRLSFLCPGETSAWC